MELQNPAKLVLIRENSRGNGVCEHPKTHLAPPSTLGFEMSKFFWDAFPLKDQLSRALILLGWAMNIYNVLWIKAFDLIFIYYCYSFMYRVPVRVLSVRKIEIQTDNQESNGLWWTGKPFEFLPGSRSFSPVALGKSASLLISLSYCTGLLWGEKQC